MRKYLLPNSGQFYKTNLHMHTTVSDGNMTPEQTKEAYKEKGYSIIAFTDHEVMVPHPELDDENFLALTSTEVSINHIQVPGRPYEYVVTYHLNLYSPQRDKYNFQAFNANASWGNARAYIKPEQKNLFANRSYSIENINAIIAEANKEGMLVSYNHPVWSNQSYNDYVGLKGLWGVEWHNTGCVVEEYPDTIRPIEDLAQQGEYVVPLATDDAHRLSHCFGGWCMIKADKLDYDTVFAAMKRGDMYSSNGPEIKELYIENGIVHVETSAAARIAITTERRWTRCARGEAITSADFDINGYLNNTYPGEYKSMPYFRITVTDDKGKIAYSRPYKLSEIYDFRAVEKE